VDGQSSATWLQKWPLLWHGAGSGRAAGSSSTPPVNRASTAVADPAAGLSAAWAGMTANRIASAQKIAMIPSRSADTIDDVPRAHMTEAELVYFTGAVTQRACNEAPGRAHACVERARSTAPVKSFSGCADPHATSGNLEHGQLTESGNEGHGSVNFLMGACAIYHATPSEPPAMWRRHKTMRPCQESVKFRW
jgi:hypothetical protein